VESLLDQKSKKVTAFTVKAAIPMSKLTNRPPHREEDPSCRGARCGRTLQKESTDPSVVPKTKKENCDAIALEKEKSAAWSDGGGVRRYFTRGVRQCLHQRKGLTAISKKRGGVDSFFRCN